MKNIYLFLLISFFVSCDQVQKDAKDLTKDKIYNPEEQLNKIGISLPEVSAPVANYVRAVKLEIFYFYQVAVLGKVMESTSLVKLVRIFL